MINAVMPTGTCFTDALEILESWIKCFGRDDWFKDVRVCHGIIDAGSGEGPISHAWLARDERVWQAGLVGSDKLVIQLSRQQFYQNVVTVTEHSLEDVARLNRSSGHYGPWEGVYLDLCNDRGGSRRKPWTVEYTGVKGWYWQSHIDWDDLKT